MNVQNILTVCPECGHTFEASRVEAGAEVIELAHKYFETISSVLDGKASIVRVRGHNVPRKPNTNMKRLPEYAQFRRDMESCRRKLACFLKFTGGLAKHESGVTLERGADEATTYGWTDFRLYEPGPERSALVWMSAVAGRLGLNNMQYRANMWLSPCYDDARVLLAAWMMRNTEPWFPGKKRNKYMTRAYGSLDPAHKAAVKAAMRALWRQGIALVPDREMIEAAAATAGFPTGRGAALRLL
jgi:hypothetical protein